MTFKIVPGDPRILRNQTLPPDPVVVWLEDDGSGWVDLKYLGSDGRAYAILSVGGIGGGLVRHVNRDPACPFGLDGSGRIL